MQSFNVGLSEEQNVSLRCIKNCYAHIYWFYVIQVSINCMLIIWSVKVFASQLLSTSSEVLKVKPPLVEITLAHDYPAQVVKY